MKRKLLIVALIVLLVAGIGLLVGKQLLVGYLTPDFLVRQIENRWNCRAQIESVSVNLLGTATVEVSGVSLAPRDGNADKGLPLAERTPLPNGAVELQSDSVFLEIRPAELIRRQLNIRQLVLQGLEVSTLINRDGDASIERLFDPVETNNATSLPVGEANSQKPFVFLAAVTPGDSAESVEAIAEKEFEAGDLSFATVADRVEVQDGILNFHIESSGADIRLEAFQLSLTEIDINPKSLDSHNRAAFQFGGDLIVQPPAERAKEEGEEYLRSHLTGAGKIRPFNPKTGKIDPVWSADLTLHQGAQINTFPVLAKLHDLLEGVDTAGVDLSDLNIRGTLLEDANTEIGHGQGKYLIKKPLELTLPDTILVVRDGSWLHSGTNQHKMKGMLVASEALTQKIEGKVEAYLAEKAKGFPPETLRNLVMSPLMKDGRLVIEFSSEGDLSKPEADIVTPFGNLSEVLGTGKDTLKTLEKAGKSLLKNLFGN